VKDDHVKLSGRLRRYYLRQIAQQAAMTTDGVTTLESQIEIDR
jgi:osmotically-inducible protein OsmY